MKGIALRAVFLLPHSGIAQQVFEWRGGGGNGCGAKKECVDEILGLEGHAWKFSFNFSKMTENAFTAIKLLIFFLIFRDVAIGSQNSSSLD